MRSVITALIVSLVAGSIALADDAPKADVASAGYAATYNRLLPLAQSGDRRAQHDLGLMYDKGMGVAQDNAQAVKWYALAAQQGDAASQTALGFKYYKGQGVSQDYKEAARWYRMAAGQGDAAAQYDLGLMYKQGLGVPQDYVRAYLWFRLASGSSRPAVAPNLAFVAQKLSPAQTAQAETFVSKCKASAYHDCDN